MKNGFGSEHLDDTAAFTRNALGRPSTWLAWLLGAAIVVIVILVARHIAEEKAFVGLLEQAQPSWLIIAIVLQATTYLVQGELWRTVARAANSALSIFRAYKLSLIKLFVDQSLPSAGISGNVVAAQILERYGIPRRTVMASVILNMASFYIAHCIGLILATVIIILERRASLLLLAAISAFLAFSVIVTLIMLRLPGARTGRFRSRIQIPIVKRTLALIAEAEAKLVRSPLLLVKTTALQLTIIVLDAATLWILIQSLGGAVSAGGVFASFMVSTLLRMIGLVPGGLGTFEAMSTFTLRKAGAPISVALAATLLFRGFTFWLPMVPGLIFLRKATSSARRTT